MSIAQTKDFGSCIDKCTTTEGCIVVTYWGGNCYLKNEKRPAEFNSNLQSECTRLSCEERLTDPDRCFPCDASRSLSRFRVYSEEKEAFAVTMAH